jgi:hypothetical protein
VSAVLDEPRVLPSDPLPKRPDSPKPWMWEVGRAFCGECREWFSLPNPPKLNEGDGVRVTCPRGHDGAAHIEAGDPPRKT